MSDVIAAWRTAFEAGDPAGVLEALSPDVELRSPITLNHVFHGKEEMRSVLEAVLAVESDVEYLHEIGSGDRRVLIHRAKVGGQEIEQSTLVGLGPDGLIRELKLYVRPLPGLITLAAALAPRLAPTRARALLLSAMLKPLAFVLRTGDPLGNRLAFGRRD